MLLCTWVGKELYLVEIETEGIPRGGARARSSRAGGKVVQPHFDLVNRDIGLAKQSRNEKGQPVSTLRVRRKKLLPSFCEVGFEKALLLDICIRAICRCCSIPRTSLQHDVDALYQHSDALLPGP